MIFKIHKNPFTKQIEIVLPFNSNGKRIVLRSIYPKKENNVDNSFLIRKQMLNRMNEILND